MVHRRSAEGCQSSWWCNGDSSQPTQEPAWHNALQNAQEVLTEGAPDPTHGALFYPNSSTHPSWADGKRLTARIENHLFYK